MTFIYWSVVGLIAIWLFPLTFDVSNTESPFSLVPLSTIAEILKIKFAEHESVFQFFKDFALLFLPTLLAGVVLGWSIPIMSKNKTLHMTIIKALFISYIIEVSGIAYQYSVLKERLVDTSILIFTPLAVIIGYCLYRLSYKTKNEVSKNE